MGKNKFAISIFTENKPGLLNRVTIIFNRRKVNIDSISASESEVEGIYRYTIFVTETEEIVTKIVKQIEKQVDIFKAFYHPENELVTKEFALLKVNSFVFNDVNRMEKLLKDFSAKISFIDKQFVVIEVVGDRSDITALYNEFKSFGLLEFVRSGTIAITKPMKTLKEFIN